MLLSARKAGTEALRVGDSTTLVGGERGAAVTLPELDTEEMEEWRATAGRLERKPCGATSTSGVGTAAAVAFFWAGFVLRERKSAGKGMW